MTEIVDFLSISSVSFGQLRLFSSSDGAAILPIKQKNSLKNTS